MLRKYERDPSHTINWQLVDIREDASYIERPVRILDKKEQVLRNKVIPLVKVQWGHHNEEEASGELEAEIKEKYPELFK